jgi:hypothetical protein
MESKFTQGDRMAMPTPNQYQMLLAGLLTIHKIIAPANGC